MDEQFSVHSVTETELINIFLRKLRHKICVRIQWSSTSHTCCSFELLNFPTTALLELWAKEKTNQMFLSPKFGRLNLAGKMNLLINETLKQNELFFEKLKFFTVVLVVVYFIHSSLYITYTEWALKYSRYDRNCMFTSLLLKNLNTSFFWTWESKRKKKQLSSVSGVFRHSHISLILLYYLKVTKKWYLMK